MTPADVRHRLLDGLLLRLAASPSASDFVLRGGMLLRHWFRPRPRVAADLDLVATFPFDLAATAGKLVPLLADTTIADGVTFDPDRYRVEPIWQCSDYPGVRMFGAGEVHDHEDEFSIDVTFGEPLVPPPIAIDYTTGCGQVARMTACRPETIVGRKLHALRHMAGQHWRPKDLHDLHLLLAHVPLVIDDLAAGIAESFTSRGDPPAEAANVLRYRWWGQKSTAARWRDFAPGRPTPVGEVVAAVAARLQPALERLT